MIIFTKIQINFTADILFLALVLMAARRSAQPGEDVGVIRLIEETEGSSDDPDGNGGN